MTGRLGRGLVAALFFLSGAASLVYEVVWMRSLGLVLGTTAVATTIVLAGFMGGLGAGAAAGATLAGWSRRPLAVYGALEIAIAGAALALPAAFRTLGAAPAGVAMAAGALLVALAASAMGATFPLVCAAGSRAPRVEVLYGANTLGATLGAAGSAFFLLPSLGMAQAGRVAAAASLAVGIAAIALDFRRAPCERASDAPHLLSAGENSAEIPIAFAAIAAALAGFAGLVLEVVHARVFALVLGGSVYAFATVLASFLFGIGLGSLVTGAVAARLSPRAIRPLAAGALALAGGAAFAGLFAIPELPYLFVVLFRKLGSGPALEAALAGGLPLVSAFGLGAAFAALARGAGGGARAAGRLYASNTLGAIAGAALGGLALVPALGIAGTTAVASAAAALAAAAVLARPAALGLAFAACAAFLALRPALPPPVVATGAYSYAGTLPADLTRARFFSQFEPGKIELAFAKDGLVSTVTVERFLFSNTVYLKNNGKVDGSAPIDPSRPSRADMATQVALAAAPLALHHAPRRALVIGLGSGVTAGAALAFSIERLDLVEIEAEVVHALRATRDFDAWNGRALDDGRTRVWIEDARLFLREAPEGIWDAIISQPAEPWLTGVANLFTREFFALGRRALREGGLFCQWIQLYGLDEEGLSILLATFCDVFPEVLVLRPKGARELLLLGSATPFSVDAERLASRLSEPRVAALIAMAGLDVDSFIGQFVAGTADVAAFAAGRPLNTDDSGAIEFRAPRTRFIEPRAAEAAFERLAGAPRGLVAAFAPPAPERRRAIATGAASAGNLAAAEAWLRSCGDGAEIHRALGDLALRRGDRAGALLEWNEALKRDPTDRGALERIVRMRQVLAGD